jgi:hypothetical protein
MSDLSRSVIWGCGVTLGILLCLALLASALFGGCAGCLTLGAVSVAETVDQARKVAEERKKKDAPDTYVVGRPIPPAQPAEPPVKDPITIEKASPEKATILEEKRKPDVDAKPSGIMEAAWSNDVPKLKELLSADASLVHEKGPGNWTPLHHAAFHGHVKAILVLIAYGADLDARATAIKAINGINAKDETPAQFAAKTGKTDVVGFLADVRSMSAKERENNFSAFRAQEEKQKTQTEDTAKSAENRPDPAAAEKKELAERKALLQAVRHTDADAILSALERIQQGPRGNNLSEMIRSVRARILPAIQPYVSKWPMSAQVALAKELESGISGMNGQVQNRIDRKMIGKHIAIFSEQCRNDVEATEKAIADKERAAASISR